MARKIESAFLRAGPFSAAPRHLVPAGSLCNVSAYAKLSSAEQNTVLAAAMIHCARESEAWRHDPLDQRFRRRGDTDTARSLSARTASPCVSSSTSKGRPKRPPLRRRRRPALGSRVEPRLGRVRSTRSPVSVQLGHRYAASAFVRIADSDAEAATLTALVQSVDPRSDYITVPSPATMTGFISPEASPSTVAGPSRKRCPCSPKVRRRASTSTSTACGAARERARLATFGRRSTRKPRRHRRTPPKVRVAACAFTQATPSATRFISPWRGSQADTWPSSQLAICGES